MNATRKYAFTWDVVGADLKKVRPMLGDNTRVEVYRLFQFSLRDILEQQYGTEQADVLFFEAGVLAGKAFFERFCKKEVSDIASLSRVLREQFRDMGIGIVRFEVADSEEMYFRLTVDEDLDCSGLPDTMDTICVYDEGFIKGILDSFSAKEFTVKEIDCWCSGARTCRFEARLSDADGACGKKEAADDAKDAGA